MPAPTVSAASIGADGTTVSITLSESSIRNIGAVTARVTARGLSATVDIPAGTATTFTGTLNTGLVFPVDTLVLDLASGAFRAASDSASNNTITGQAVTNGSEAAAGMVILPSAWRFLARQRAGRRM